MGNLLGPKLTNFLFNIWSVWFAQKDRFLEWNFLVGENDHFYWNFEFDIHSKYMGSFWKLHFKTSRSYNFFQKIKNAKIYFNSKLIKLFVSFYYLHINKYKRKKFIWLFWFSNLFCSVFYVIFNVCRFSVKILFFLFCNSHY